MAFIGSLFDDKKGSGFQAQSAPVIQQDENNLKGLASGAQGLTAQANQMLTQQALGQGPNPAASMLQQAQDQNNRQNAGLLASTKGLNPALAARMAGQNAALSNQQAANSAATMKANQMLGAQNSLMNAGMGQQQMYQNAIQGQNQANITNTTQQNQANASIAAGNQKGQQDVLGGIFNAVGSAASMFSDERVKTNIKSGAPEVEQFLDSISPKSYEYKDPRMGQGQQTSVMAQDLEKTPAGRAMVEETPAGKSVDYGKGLGVMTAAMADLHQRLKAIEGKKGYADGGLVQVNTPQVPSQSPAFSSMGIDFLRGMGSADSSKDSKLRSGVSNLANSLMGAAKSMGTQDSPMTDAGMGTSAPALGSGTFGGKPSAPSLGVASKPLLLAKGGTVTTPELTKKMKPVPGKAKVKGDSPANDTVDAKLSPGEIVIPRSVLDSRDPVSEAAKFVAAVLARKNHGAK